MTARAGGCATPAAATTTPGRISVEAVLETPPGTVVRGAVIELHHRASDWQAHEHDRNPRYNTVTLHLILVENRPGIPTLAANGRRIPRVVIDPARLQSPPVRPARRQRGNAGLWSYGCRLPGAVGRDRQQAAHVIGIAGDIRLAWLTRIFRLDLARATPPGEPPHCRLHRSSSKCSMRASPTPWGSAKTAPPCASLLGACRWLHCHAQPRQAQTTRMRCPAPPRPCSRPPSYYPLHRAGYPGSSHCSPVSLSHRAPSQPRAMPTTILGRPIAPGRATRPCGASSHWRRWRSPGSPQGLGQSVLRCLAADAPAGSGRQHSTFLGRLSPRWYGSPHHRPRLCGISVGSASGRMQRRPRPSSAPVGPPTSW